MRKPDVFIGMSQHQMLHFEDHDLSMEDTMNGIWAQKRLTYETIDAIEKSIVDTISLDAICDLTIEVEFPTFQQPLSMIRYRNPPDKETWHKQVGEWHKYHGLHPMGYVESVGEYALDSIASTIDDAVKAIVPDDVLCYVAQTLLGEFMKTIRLYQYGDRQDDLSQSFTLATRLIDEYPSMRASTDWEYTAFFTEPLQ